MSTSRSAITQFSACLPISGEARNMLAEVRKRPEYIQSFMSTLQLTIESPGTGLASRVACTVMLHALRSNTSIDQSWEDIRKKSTLPHIRNMKFEEYMNVLSTTDTIRRGAEVTMIGGRVVSKSEYKDMHEICRDADTRWMGVHSICISILENMLYKIEPLFDEKRSILKKGSSPAFSILRSRIRNLYKHSSETISREVDSNILSQSPYAHKEWLDISFSALPIVQGIVIKKYASRIDIIRKTLIIAAQKAGVSEAELFAHVYLVSTVVYWAYITSKEINEDVQKRVAGNSTKKTLCICTKDWKELWDAARELRDLICCEKDIIEGDYSDLAEQRIDELKEDITKNDPHIISAHTNLSLATANTDFSLAVIITRLRTKVPIPYSWLKDMRMRMGSTELFKRFVAECRSKKILSKIPLDDLEDARDYITGRFVDQQKCKVEEVDGHVYFMVEDSEEDKTLKKRYGAMLIWRYNMLNGSNRKSDVEPSMHRKLKDKYFTLCFKRKGECLDDETLIHLYLDLNDSQRAVIRLLKEIGPVAHKTLTYFRKLRKKDIDDKGDELIVQHYRRNGFNIPIGAERLFIAGIRNNGFLHTNT